MASPLNYLGDPWWFISTFTNIYQSVNICSAITNKANNVLPSGIHHVHRFTKMILYSSVKMMIGFQRGPRIFDMCDYRTLLYSKNYGKYMFKKFWDILYSVLFTQFMSFLSFSSNYSQNVFNSDLWESISSFSDINWKKANILMLKREVYNDTLISSQSSLQNKET